MIDLFMNRTMIATSLLSLTYFIWLSLNDQLLFGVGVLIGAFWSCINFHFIRYLCESLLAPVKSPGKICFLLGVKFPLLYSSGYAILRLDFISPYALVYGLTLFLTATLGIGASMLLLNKQALEQ